MSDSSDTEQKRFHVSFIYMDQYGLEQFSEHIVEAENEDKAVSYAENRADSPDQYDRVECKLQPESDR